MFTLNEYFLCNHDVYMYEKKDVCMDVSMISMISMDVKLISTLLSAFNSFLSCSLAIPLIDSVSIKSVKPIY